MLPGKAMNPAQQGLPVQCELHLLSLVAAQATGGSGQQRGGPASGRLAIQAL